jgi:hypothetical protein
LFARTVLTSSVISGYDMWELCNRFKTLLRSPHASCNMAAFPPSDIWILWIVWNGFIILRFCHQLLKILDLLKIENFEWKNHLWLKWINQRKRRTLFIGRYHLTSHCRWRVAVCRIFELGVTEQTGTYKNIWKQM